MIEGIEWYRLANEIISILCDVLRMKPSMQFVIRVLMSNVDHHPTLYASYIANDSSARWLLWLLTTSLASASANQRKIASASVASYAVSIFEVNG